MTPSKASDAPSAKWALGAILIVAAALRIYGIASVAPVNDEYFQFYQGLHSGTVAAFLSLIRGNPDHLLLDPLATFLMARFTDALGWLRVPEMLAGVLTVWGMWRLGRLAGGYRTAVLAAFLMAISLFQIDWSRRADFYAFLTVLTAFSTAEFVELNENPENWLRYSVVNIIFLYSHPYAVIVAASHFAFALLSSERKTLFLTLARCWGVALVAFLPWLLFSTSRLFNLDLFDFSGGHHGVLTFSRFVIGAPLFLGQAPEVGPFRAWELSIPCAFSVAYTSLYFVSLGRAFRGKVSQALRLCHLSILLWFLFIVLLDHMYRFFFAYRQLLVILPCYLVAVADGGSAALSCLEREWGVSEQAAISRRLAICAALLAAFAPAYYETTAGQENLLAGHRALVETVAEHLQPGDVLDFQTPEALGSFLFFYDRKAFSRIPGMYIIYGLPFFQVPDGFFARRGSVRNLVRLDLGDINEGARGLWRFRGFVYDLYVHPPLR